MTAAQERLVVDSLPVVENVIAKFLRRIPSHVDQDAVRGAAMEGLCQAAVRFVAGGPRNGFATFAHRRVLGAMVDELRTLEPNSRSAVAAGSGKTTVSLEIPVGENDLTLGDTIGGGDAGEEAVRNVALRRALRAPDGRRREIMLRFLAGEPLVSIARDFGLTESRVSQIAERGRVLARVELAA